MHSLSFQRLLRNSMRGIDGGTKPISAAKRRYVKARHGSAGMPEVEQTESASADGTSFVTASLHKSVGTVYFGGSFRHSSTGTFGLSGETRWPSEG